MSGLCADSKESRPLNGFLRARCRQPHFYAQLVETAACAEDSLRPGLHICWSTSILSPTRRMYSHGHRLRQRCLPLRHHGSITDDLSHSAPPSSSSSPSPYNLGHCRRCLGPEQGSHLRDSLDFRSRGTPDSDQLGYLKLWPRVRMAGTWQRCDEGSCP